MKMSPGSKKPKQGDLTQKPSTSPKAPSVKARGEYLKPPVSRKQAPGNPANPPKQTAHLPIPMPLKEGDNVRIEKIDNGFLSHHMIAGNGGEVRIKTTFHPQAVTDAGSKSPDYKGGKAQVKPLRGQPNPKEPKGLKKGND